MKNIFINLHKEELMIEKEIISFKNHLIIQEYKENIDYLAGCLLIVDNKILLVKPMKFKGQDKKWSIPKGHIEKGDSEKKTALKELKEETGIKLKNIKNKHNFFYKKNGVLKKITVYLKRMTQEELNVNVDKKTFDIKGKFNMDEIFKVKLFTYEKAIEKIEPEQKPILDIIMNELNDTNNEDFTNDELNIFKNIVFPFIHSKHKKLLKWANKKTGRTGLDLEKVLLKKFPNGEIVIELICHGHMSSHVNRMISGLITKETNKKLEELSLKDKVSVIYYQNNASPDNILEG